MNEVPETFDSLPEDLEHSYGSDEYQIPNTEKRKLAGYLYVTTGLVFALLGLMFNDSPLVNKGFLISGIFIVLFGLYNFYASIRCTIDEREALGIASGSVGFQIGPASAQLMWRGFRSRPVWRLLTYSSEEIPLTRSVILIDASTGKVLEQIVEDNPEEWDNTF